MQSWSDLSRWSWWILEEPTSLMEITSWHWGCCGALSCTGRWGGCCEISSFPGTMRIYLLEFSNFSGVLAAENNCFYSGLVNKGRPVFGFWPLSVGCLPQYTFSYVLSSQSLSSVPKVVAEAFQAKALCLCSFLNTYVLLFADIFPLSW